MNKYSFSSFLSIPALQRASSFLTLSIRDTPTKLLKHFISKHSLSFSHHFSYGVIPHASAPYNAGWYNYSFV